MVLLFMLLVLAGIIYTSEKGYLGVAFFLCVLNTYIALLHADGWL